MSALSPQPFVTPRPGLLGKLLAQVRVEFRSDIYFIDSHDLILGRGPCSVPTCDRPRKQDQLCASHRQRWHDRGCPEMTVFIAEPGREIDGRRDLRACAVSGCRFGASRLGLCTRHCPVFKRSGESDQNAWLARAGLLGSPDPVTCLLPFCTLWTGNPKVSLYCDSHTTRWISLGRPVSAEYIAHCLRRGRAWIDFRGLSPQLKLELQYAVQCRHDQATITARRPVVAWTIKLATGACVSSLLDRSPEQWRLLAGGKQGMFQRFLDDARDVVEILHGGAGWEVEYPRDVWRLHRLPGLTQNPGRMDGTRLHLRFDRLAQQWLRPLAKRWARWRLSTGLTVDTVIADLQGLHRFSTFLAEAAPDVKSLGDVDRGVLERYLAWLVTAPIGRVAKERAITALTMLFQAIRQHGWDETLAGTALFFPGDIPARPPQRARHLAEFVMAQVEAPANLDRWTTPEGRLITIILIRCGLRATDACTLAFDCLLHDGQNAPYLRYINNKMRREAAVPIDEDLEGEIHAQQQRVAARWPENHPCLFPSPHHNAAGQHPVTYYSYHGMLNDWLTRCDVRDEHGGPAHLTPHQWRHTFGTRLINKDVPQEVIRVLLDHESSQMTAHYARMTDQTVRRRWAQATKVNIRGEMVSLDPDGPLAQAQWARTRYDMATQTLPHGYCAMPAQKSCPHANACLTCPVFLTGPEFLPELREHRGRTLTLIDQAEANGHTRVGEMNKDVLANLDRMIGGIDQQEGEEDAI